MPSSSYSQTSADASTDQPARRGRKAASGGLSLREHVLAVLERAPQTKEEVLAAVKARGYRFSTSNPLNSLGVILYGKNPKFIRNEGRFSLAGAVGNGFAAKQIGGSRKRKMSPAARKAIAAAARKSWAAAKAAGRKRL